MTIKTELAMTELAKRLTKALYNDEEMGEKGIDVVDLNGVVTLIGSVPSALVKDRAEAIVSGFDDVISVVNELKIDTEDHEPDTILLPPISTTFPTVR